MPPSPRRLTSLLLLFLLAACSRDFVLPGSDGPSLCGNNELDADEECEDGNLSINDHCPSGSGGTCTDAVCGDGYAWVDGHGANEECDDGNDLPGDGCYRCQLEESWICAFDERNSPCWCAAGYQDHDEDGRCDPSCTNLELRPTTAHEVCDDSSGTVSYACTVDAEIEPEDGICELSTCDPACGLHQACIESGGVGACACRPSWIGADCGTCRVLVDPNAGCNDCTGLEWATALPTLQAGIDLAAERAAGLAQHCEVWVRQGHYWIYENAPQDTVRLEPWVALYGGFAGTEQVRDQRDWRANRTILDGHAGPDSIEQTWHVVIPGSNTILDGFIITGGRAAGRHGDHESFLDDDGGALLLYEVENVRVANTALVDNAALTEGGAARVLASSIVFENCIFTGNNTWNDIQFNRGGAIHSNWSATELHSCVLAGNRSDGNAVSFWNAQHRDANLVSNTLAVGNQTHTVFDNIYSPTRIHATTVAGNADTTYGPVMRSWYTTARVAGCIFAAHGGTDLYHNGAATELSHTIFEGSDCGGNGANCLPGTGVVDAPPGFASVPGTDTGSWDTVTWDPMRVETILTDTDAGWSADEHADRFVQPDTADVRQFPILANTDTTLTVLGNLSGVAASGATYQLFDYRLDPASPAIDAGANLESEGLTEDLLGAPRNICHTGSLPDCYDAGAYELQ